MAHYLVVTETGEAPKSRVLRLLQRFLSAWQALADRGFLTAPFVPPYVPASSARLRVGITYNHTHDDVLGFKDALTTHRSVA